MKKYEIPEDFDMSDELDELTESIVSLPVLPLRGIVLFPDMMLHFDVGRKKSALAIDSAMRTNQTVFVTTQKDVDVHDPKKDDLYKIGVIARVVQVLKQPEGIIRVVVEGVCRAAILGVVKEKPYFTAQIQKIYPNEFSDSKGDEVRELALIRSAKKIFEEYVRLSPKMATDILYKVGTCKKAGQLADFIAGNIVLEHKKKQEILEAFDPLKRLAKLIDILFDEVYILGIEEEINNKARERIDYNQREYYLHEQMRAIQEELGEDEDPADEVNQYREKIKALTLAEEVHTALLKEADKLLKMPYGSQEANVVRNYLDLCLELPWDKKTKERIDVSKVRKQLDKNHYGLSKVKENILEALAVRKLSPEVKGQILCLVGPPGVGKTSIAQSIAAAINRKSQRIALGGVHDESEIRGHRRTYIGAMPGRIINALKLAKSNNPLIILDEVDKLGSDYKGDPTSALLEVLDSEQNNAFYDHYVDLPFDLSNVMFITTANDRSQIPEPLLDRMDVIELASYTREEKFNIAKKHLLPKQMKNCGINSKMFKLKDDAIYDIIDSYTREAGVRNLERKIIALLRKAAVSILEQGEEKITVSSKNIEEFLGPRKYKNEKLSEENEVGVCTGLAWTSVGGETLPVEVSVVEGTGKLELTGSLGDVMKESAKLAVTCVRGFAERYGIDKQFYKNCDIHIHAPEGAVPKDGPSAGVTMTTALVSALSDMPVKRDVAMTGEITLRGKVLPIGGLKEKAMAAYRYGVNTVIIPYDNAPDLAEIDPVVKESINFIPVKSIYEVLDYAIVPKKEKNVNDSPVEGILPKVKGVSKVVNTITQ